MSKSLADINFEHGVIITAGRAHVHNHPPNEPPCRERAVGDMLYGECVLFAGGFGKDTDKPPTSATEDVVNHPPHYNKGKIQMTDYVLDQQLGWCSGNVIKYVVRSRWKGKRLEDLKKAAWYLNHLIKLIEGGGEE